MLKERDSSPSFLLIQYNIRAFCKAAQTIQANRDYNHFFISFFCTWPSSGPFCRQNPCSVFFLLDVSYSNWQLSIFCGCLSPIIVNLCNLFLLSIPVAQMFLTPRWVNKQKDVKQLFIQSSPAEQSFLIILIQQTRETAFLSLNLDTVRIELHSHMPLQGAKCYIALYRTRMGLLFISCCCLQFGIRESYIRSIQQLVLLITLFIVTKMEILKNAVKCITRH